MSDNQITMKEAANRIIICGVKEIPDLLEAQEIGGIVSVCRSSEYLSQDVNPIALGTEKGIPHYQSLALETGLGLSEVDLNAKSEQELRALECEEVGKTLDALDIFLNNAPNQKIILHCWAGSDRSASMAVAFFLQCQGSNPNIDEAIRTMHRIRPHAILDRPYEHFRDFWGEKADEYIGTLKEFHGTIMSNSIYSYFGRKHSKDFRCLKHAFDDMADKSSGNGSQKYLRYVSRCNRFGINMKAWLHSDVTNPYIKTPN